MPANSSKSINDSDAVATEDSPSLRQRISSKIHHTRPRENVGARTPPTVFHTKEASELEAELHTDLSTGLSSSDVSRLRNEHGPNTLPEPERTSVPAMFMHQIFDFMVLLLVASAVLSAIFEDVKSSIVLLVVVVINVTIGFTQEFKAERALTNLLASRIAQQKATVLRDGRNTDIPSSELVPGDIVLLEEGDQVPADIRLAEASHFQIDEAVLTGESVPADKKIKPIKKELVPLGDRNNMAYLMTMVARGRAKGIVVATGTNTEVGKNSKAIMAKSGRKKTNLQAKLSWLGKWLVLVAIVLCALFTLIGYLRGFPLKEMIETGVSLAVSVIPEGLVAVTTVTMALGVQRLAKRQAIVRKLPAVEVLGAVSIICSDKTGTLTEGKMKVDQIWFATKSEEGRVIYVEGPGNIPEGSICSDKECKQPLTSPFDEGLNKLLTACALCNNASVTRATPQQEQQGRRRSSVFRRASISPSDPKGKAKAIEPKETDRLLPRKSISAQPEQRRRSIWGGNSSTPAPEEEWEAIGTPTEVALQVLAMKAGMGKDVLTNGHNHTHNPAHTHEHGKGAQWHFIRDLPFDSERKRMSVVYKGPEGEGVIFAKGALEFLMPLCTTWSCEGQQEAALGEQDKERIAKQAQTMAAQGMRVLAVAYRKGGDLFAKVDDSSEDENLDEEMEHDLCFIGLVGLMDPPRTQVAGCIETCHNAGISVCMITGDHPSTALCIAKQLKLIPEETTEDQALGNSSVSDDASSPPPSNPGGALMIVGTDVDQMTDEQLAALEPFPNVFARASPDAKLRIVKALQIREKIVAFIGDGVNDAASIKHADVGVAMGRTGTDLSQQSADIILSDDNFEHIVTAVEEGRRTYDNIFKFTIYLLSCNSAEIFVMLGATAFNIPMPFTSIQILFANIIADVPPSLSLGVEPVEKDVMERHPRNPKQAFFRWRHALAVVMQGMSMSVLCLAAFVSALHFENYPIETARCLGFVMLVMIQLWHAFLSRSFSISVFRTGIIGNKWMIGAFFLSSACLIGGMYIPGLNSTLDLIPLSLIDWGKIAGAVFVHTIIVETIKIFIRWRHHKKGNYHTTKENV
eukprot:TRINITY_DN10405_c0_g1_i1.p1 TRINITY_DN10405_c0_g1~~TRINITY_DN10405_c0_g1_i1.p1  ORF type:complete len:1085 (-),score=269.31 TRINITY_DN10405_c0_g1_i1:38-3292(-)